MRRSNPAPQGLVGAGERLPIGVHLSMSKKHKDKGSPTAGFRFWFMTQTTRSVSFGRFSSPTRDLHPGFRTWNDAAHALGEQLGPHGPGRIGVVRGNLLWADLGHNARWSRSAQKPPEGAGVAPPSRRPWCEGNGIAARRYRGLVGAEEDFGVIPCPNEDCPVALAGMCKPSAHLVFRLRWDRTDPFEAQLPSMICEWTTHGWQSIANLRGIFELVLGTEAVRTPEEAALADPEDRAAWSPGLAADFGVESPSLVGLPFAMMISARTKAAKPGAATGTVFPVVSFSFDGDPAEWLLSQRRTRLELQGAPEKLMLPSVQEPYFEQVERHDSRVEILPEYVEGPAESLLAPEEVTELRRLCGELGASWDAVEERLGGPVAETLGPSRDSLRRRVRDAIEALAPQEG